MASANENHPLDIPDKINLRAFGTWPLSVAVFGIVTLIYCLSLMPRTFWAENEAYYALGAGNVLEGNLLLPVIYDTMLADKPPLMFWWVALVSLPFGAVSEYTARVSNLIPGLLILFIVYRFARQLGLKSALLAMVVLATAHEFYEVTFEVNTDIVLTGFLLLSWIALFKIMHVGFTWKRWLVLWIPMGLGLLTKGPIAPALSCLIAVAYAFPRYGWREGWKKLLSLRPFIGGAVCFIPFVAWCFAVYNQYGREPLDIILLRHNVQRFVAAFDHQKPWYYYLYTLPIVMLPWTVFFPAVAMDWWRSKREQIEIPAWRSFALTVCAVVFIMFSLSSSKRAYYMLPLMPWLALVLADTMVRTGSDREPEKRRKIHKWIKNSAIGMLILLTIYVGIAYPLLDQHRSIKALVQEVEHTTAEAEHLLLFAEEDPRVMFYLRENMTYYADKPAANRDMAEVLSEGSKVDIISLKRPLPRLLEISPVPLYVEGSAIYRKNRYFILTTQASGDFPELTPAFIEDAKARKKPKRL